MGTTLVNLQAVKHRFQAVQLPTIQREPEHGDGWVRFVQTCGGRTGVPAPRRVRRRPSCSGRRRWCGRRSHSRSTRTAGSEHTLIGASRFPRHWVYDGENKLSHKSGLTDFKDWYRKSFGKHSPVGRRGLRGPGVRGRVRPRDLALGAGDAGWRQAAHRAVPGRGRSCSKQGEPGTEVLLILDGDRPDRARRRAPRRVRPRRAAG